MTANSLHNPKSQSMAVRALNTALRDVYRGFIEITHNSMALLGTTLAVALIVLSARSDLRLSAEQQLLGWLQQRHEPGAGVPVEAIDTDPQAIERVTASLPHTLPAQQAKVAYWLSRKYRVAPEPLSVLVAEAFRAGHQVKLDPTLILAVMAVESRFNPFAQSPVGAQGLMQVLTRVHTDKYEDFGGELAAFDPVSNLRVGVQVLRDCIRRAGSVEGGLRLYVGAVSSDGSDYINKVMAEHLRIQSVALGKPMPTVFPVYQAAPAAVPAELPAADAAVGQEPADPATEAVPAPQGPSLTLAPAVPSAS